MSISFASTWAYCWLIGFALFAVVGISIRIPLPPFPWPLVIGAACGAWITGPIVIYSLTR